MKIVETYSHLNGLEYLIVHRPELWKEVQQVIKTVDAKACRTKVSKEVRMQGELKYSPIEPLAKLFLKRSAMTFDARISASNSYASPLFAAISQIFRISPHLSPSAFPGQAGLVLFLPPSG